MSLRSSLVIPTFVSLTNTSWCDSGYLPSCELSSSLSLAISAVLSNCSVCPLLAACSKAKLFKAIYWWSSFSFKKTCFAAIKSKISSFKVSFSLRVVTLLFELDSGGADCRSGKISTQTDFDLTESESGLLGPTILCDAEESLIWESCCFFII